MDFSWRQYQHLVLKFFGYFIPLWTLVSCSSSKLVQEKSQDPNYLALSDDSFSRKHQKKEDGEEVDLVDSEDEDDPYPHPKGTEAWELQELLSANEELKSEDWRGCSQRVTEAAQGADNDEALLRTRKKIALLIYDNLDVYHWCFYKMNYNAEQDLLKDGLSFEARGQLFYAEMKKLWIFAKALEAGTNDPHYFAFVKSRYIDLSKKIFGRNIESIAPSLDERRK